MSSPRKLRRDARHLQQIDSLLATESEQAKWTALAQYMGADTMAHEMAHEIERRHPGARVTLTCDPMLPRPSGAYGQKIGADPGGNKGDASKWRGRPVSATPAQRKAKRRAIWRRSYAAHRKTAGPR